jgi:SAM-dependent methyltransferase
VYDFEKAIKEWSRPPFTGVGYFSTEDLMKEPDVKIRSLVEGALDQKYNGVDNIQNKWRIGLKTDRTYGKTIIDFGCGMGIESLELAKTGNEIILADISKSNIEFSERVLQIWGVGDRIVEKVLVTGEYPFFECRPFDVFHSPGVLHHTPKAGEILRRANELLKPHGELRLMLYSEYAWKNHFDINVTKETDTASHKDFEQYVKARDEVGEYADWYSKEKLQALIGDIYKITYHDYTSSGNTFAIFRLKRKNEVVGKLQRRSRPL